MEKFQQKDEAGKLVATESEIHSPTLCLATSTCEDINHNLAALESLKFENDASLELTTRVLGKGGFGTVVVGYAHSKHVDGKVAVKRMKFDGDMKKSNQVAREILLMKVLGQHPNILPCYGYTTSPGLINIVMEYAPFGALSEIIDPTLNIFHELLPLLILAWLHDLACALQFMHSHNIKHKDIKAQNILVYRMFQIKLGDFGFAKQHIVNVNTTTWGGSIPFMALEVRNGYQSTLSSDMFSFAMTAAQIMTRNPLGPKVVPTASQRETQMRAAVSTLALPFMSEHLLWLLMRCASDDPLQRANAEEVCCYLKEILSHNDNNAWYGYIEDMNNLAMREFNR
jgi:serine/threonine protein kinase